MLAACLGIKLLLGISLKVMVLQIIVGIIIYIVSLLLMKDEYLQMLLFRLKLIVRRKK